jgi:hypothetical protein
MVPTPAKATNMAMMVLLQIPLDLAFGDPADVTDNVVASLSAKQISTIKSYINLTAIVH